MKILLTTLLILLLLAYIIRASIKNLTYQEPAKLPVYTKDDETYRHPIKTYHVREYVNYRLLDRALKAHRE